MPDEKPANSGQFRKGTSGNPNGRPTVNKFRRQLAEYESTIVQRLVDICISAKDETALKGIKIACEYLYGKPRDSMDNELQQTVEKVNQIMRQREKEHGNDRRAKSALQ
jgi:hypothetical protein